MPELKFETGLVSYSLNGKCDVQFNPADGEFVERFYSAFEALGQLQDEYGKKEHPDAPGEYFSLFRERDSKMVKIIDDLFGAPVCEAVFDGVSICAFADGFPVWMNLMVAIADVMLDNLDDVEKKMDPRVEKYTAKYKKYAAKYHK